VLANEWRKRESERVQSEAGKKGGRGHKKPLDTVSKGFEPRNTRIESARLFAVPERKVRAERRAGELLKKMPKAKGGQPYQEKPTGNQVFSVDSLRARH